MNIANLIICPICRAPKEKHWLVCDACWREVPFKLKAEYWTQKANHHHRPKDYESRFTQAMAVIISHLKQFSSALP